MSRRNSNYINKESTFQHFKLLKDIPLCHRGAIFYYDPKDATRGSIASGCLKLAWLNGSCQDGLCAETIVFHASAIAESEWFQKVDWNYVTIVGKLQGFLNALGFRNLLGNYLLPFEIEEQITIFLIDKNPEIRELAGTLYEYLQREKQCQIPT